MLIQAKSGTGKRLVYSALAAHLASGKMKDECIAVVLTSDLEAKYQIKETLDGLISSETSAWYFFIVTYFWFQNMFFSFFIDNEDNDSCEKKIADGCKIAIGSPPRLAELVQRGLLSLEHCKLVVMDHADQMMSSFYQENIQ